MDLCNIAFADNSHDHLQSNQFWFPFSLAHSMALECVVLYGLRSLFAAYSLEELSVFAALQVGLRFWCEHNDMASRSRRLTPTPLFVPLLPNRVWPRPPRFATPASVRVRP